MSVCEVTDLRKVFGAIVACDNVSFEVKKGEILGLIGANGAGKTTTINAIMGLVFANSGQINLFGQDALGKNRAILRKDVGYCGGEVSFFKHLTVHQNLKFVADCKGVNYDRLEELAKKLDLNLSRKAKDLSLGNKKKMGLIAALLHSPKLIILDEPTEGLDPLVKQSFIKIIEEEKARGASLMISSHALADIQRLCDRVAIISRGKIIAVEAMEELKFKRAKVITVETKKEKPAITIDNVSNLIQEGTFSKFNYSGDMKPLIKFLNTIDIVNVQINDASLEQMFLHFYE